METPRHIRDKRSEGRNSCKGEEARGEGTHAEAVCAYSTNWRSSAVQWPNYKVVCQVCWQRLTITRMSAHELHGPE